MGTEHLVNISNKPTERGHIANMHNSRLLNTFQHCPPEALEHHSARLLTLRAHRYIADIGIELEHLPKITTPNEIADSLRLASLAIDSHRATLREHITAPMYTPEYNKELRKTVLPLHFHTKLLKHLTPLWTAGITKWEEILSTTTQPIPTLQMLPIKAKHANLTLGDLKPSTDLLKALKTLSNVISSPSDTEHRTLPKANVNEPLYIQNENENENILQHRKKTFLRAVLRARPVGKTPD